MKFAMYGSGAAGSVFASYLRKGGADIILIDRYEAHMKKVAEEGMHFTIHQEEDGGYKDYDYQLKGFRTYTTAADAAAAEGKVDVIIYMTKATQLEQAIQDSMPVVGDTTVAVSLINGLGNDDNLFKVFPKERCIIGSGVLGTALPEPAHCVSTPAGGVQMNFGGAVRSELTDAACAEMLKCYRAGGCDAYWRDGGTITQFYDAHMDLIAYVPEFNLYNQDWPIYTMSGNLPPAKFVHAGRDRLGHATDSIVSPGVIVSGGEVHHSVLSPNVRIHSWSQVVDSILFDGVVINRRARVYKAILDKNVVLTENSTVGIDTEHDLARGFTVTPEGITVVPKGTVVDD